MEPHVRAKITIFTATDVANFVSMINRDGTPDRYIIESFDGALRFNARSMLQVIAAVADLPDELYLVNDTNNGHFPDGLDKFRG